MECFLIWCLFGMVAAILATQKGRSGFGWFLLGVLIGPFALIVALLPSREDQSRHDALRYGQAAGYRKCPSCAEAIRAEAVKCYYL